MSATVDPGEVQHDNVKSASQEVAAGDVEDPLVTSPDQLIAAEEDADSRAPAEILLAAPVPEQESPQPPASEAAAPTSNAAADEAGGDENSPRGAGAAAAGVSSAKEAEGDAAGKTSPASAGGGGSPPNKLLLEPLQPDHAAPVGVADHRLPLAGDAGATAAAPHSAEAKQPPELSASDKQPVHVGGVALPPLEVAANNPEQEEMGVHSHRLVPTPKATTGAGAGETSQADCKSAAQRASGTAAASGGQQQQQGAGRTTSGKDVFRALCGACGADEDPKSPQAAGRPKEEPGAAAAGVGEAGAGETKV